MRWPWCSRAMLDVVVKAHEAEVVHLKAEQARLVAENARLLEHTIRVARVEHRMPEVPREARDEIEPMPSTLATYIGQWGSPKTQQMQVREARQRRQSGVPWAIVERDLRLKEQAPDGFAAAEAQHPAR